MLSSYLKDDFDTLANSFARQQAFEDRLRQVEELRQDEDITTHTHTIARTLLVSVLAPAFALIPARSIAIAIAIAISACHSPFYCVVKDRSRNRDKDGRIEIAPAGSIVEAHKAIKEGGGEAGEGEGKGEEAYGNGREDGQSEAEESKGERQREAFQFRIDSTSLSALRTANQSIDAKMSVLRTIAG
ncbi:hypothetical protein MBM_01453 [Drepanopeziza brunnea f. sp. 'multigermtubi' MB_m1]|uniref:Uncharacterized protein n=1 Tax=Marssonina brunnea f. sp. multigermtubi (strain MB_m1) TaxID=1072389 RepID=K1X6Q8_MARBU|nr:uncharacterized protein MBM_01453 [Drepanopeziza brunnea f. sp. 'multigermtubi' MB_m1]EKD20771.1 hypothetical protein MBM_01453 [Drepanopeziza brunnea f. sp. 'multigermtubi' MB_m1]